MRTPLFPSFSLLVILLGLSGCTSPQHPSFCERAVPQDLVQSVSGTDIAIENGTLILHAARSIIEVRDASGCHAGTAADIRVGDRLAHDADEIAESYPAQAWPDHVTIVH